MRAIFLSDAHLRHPEDENYRLLLDFLNRQKDLDALFLLGDLFEFWWGYQHIVFSAYVPLLEKLRQLNRQGTALYFVEGNHDFNMGPYFTGELNCTLIPDQRILEWDGLKLLLCHGDLLKPDPGYRRLRSLLRSQPLRLLSRIIHPDLVWSFALRMCDRGPKQQPQKFHLDPTLYLKALAANQTADSTDAIICGHYHHPVETEYQGIKLLALGDWINQFSYAELKDGQLKLQHFGS